MLSLLLLYSTHRGKASMHPDHVIIKDHNKMVQMLCSVINVSLE